MLERRQLCAHIVCSLLFPITLVEHELCFASGPDQGSGEDVTTVTAENQKVLLHAYCHGLKVQILSNPPPPSTGN